MKTVTVNKEELLSKLRENLTNHINDYNATIGAQKLYAEELYNDALIRVMKIGEVTRHFDLDLAVSYESSYNKAIKMLEMSIDDKIELTDNEFDNYVMDNWVWQHAFQSTMSKYVG